MGVETCCVMTETGVPWKGGRPVSMWKRVAPAAYRSVRPSMATSLDVRYGPGSYFRPFREHDEVRVAEGTLHHKSTGRSLDLNAVVVRRQRGNEMVLLTTGPQFGVAGRVMAEVYFQRWPVQEDAFKQGAAAVKLGRHRGNSGQVVTNVAVVTKLERVEGRLVLAEERLGKLNAVRSELDGAVEETRREHEGATGEVAGSRGRIEELHASGAAAGEELCAAALSLEEAVGRLETSLAARTKAEKAQEKNEEKRTEVLTKIEELVDRVEELEPRREIRQLDVALDEVMTAFKLMAMLLGSYVLREYLSSLPMTLSTFVTRVLRVRGRRETGPEQEWVVFYRNERDPEVSEAVERCCEELNRRGLRRNGRSLGYRVEDAPEKSGSRPVHLK